MPIPYEKFLYLYPPRPSLAVRYDSPGFIAYRDSGAWIAEIKANGQRNMLYFTPDGEVQWWNRHEGGHQNFLAPDWLVDQLREHVKSTGKWMVLDGEILHAKVVGGPKNTIMLWDVLVHDGQYLLGATRRQRKQLLLEILGATEVASHQHIRRLSENLWVAEDIQPAQWEEWPELIKIPWVEGFVLKTNSGRLKAGLVAKNNDDWQVRCRKPTSHIRYG